MDGLLLHAGHQRTLISPLPATVTLAGTFVTLTMLNYRAERKRAERTERRLASAEERTEGVRQESETRYQRLVENVSDAIIMGDTEGDWYLPTGVFASGSGCKDREIGDLMLEDYVAPEWREAVREQHRLRSRERRFRIIRNTRASAPTVRAYGSRRRSRR